MATSDVRVVLKRSGIRELLRSAGVLSDLGNRAERIASAAGPGHEVQRYTGRNRARATVRTATMEARVAEATDRRLTRAADAAR